MKKLIIFDLDGTLLNTIDDLGAAANHALVDLGYPAHSPQAYRLMVGGGVRRLMERALPDGTASDQAVLERALAEFKAYYADHMTDRSAPYPGIPELLDELTARGIRVAVASNKYEAATRHLISHFFPNIAWGVVCGSVEGVPVKPDPSIVFRVLTDCPTPKAEVLYVGDSGVDMETARRACVDSAGVTWGFRSSGELRSNYAMHIVTDPSQILDLALK